MLRDLYDRISTLPLDSLPYTNQFEEIHREFLIRTRVDITHWHLMRALYNIRKAKKLPRKGEGSMEGVETL